VAISHVSLPYESLGEHLLKLSETVYLFLVPYDHHFKHEDMGPYISQALWAQSEGAVRRAYLNEIDADPGDNGELPPSSFCLEPHIFCYRDILESAKSKKYGSYLVHASYPFMGEGKDAPFLHKTISVSDFKFHFRSRDDNPSEHPYVIAYRGRRSTRHST
jgi:hypothetical protein